MDRLPLDLVSRCLMNYSARHVLELGLEGCRSGQWLDVSQTGLSQGIDDGGSEYIVPLHRARLVTLDTDGDGVRETLARLLEPARTNSWTKSRDLTDAVWTKSGLQTPGVATGFVGPDGLSTAYKMKEDTSTGTHQWSRNAGSTPTDNLSTTYSFAIRPSQRTWIWVQTTNKAGNVYTSWVDVTNAVVGTVDSHHTIWLGRRRDGYVRIAVATGNGTGATTSKCEVGIATADAVSSYLGISGNGVWCMDMQCEVDAFFPSSFMPTTSASASRGADQLQTAIDVPLPTQLTVFFDVGRPAHADLGASLDIVTAPYIWNWGSTVGAARLGLYFQNDARNIAAIIDTASGSVTVSQAIPAGRRLTGCAQFRTLTTGGQVRLDVGAGFGSWSSVATSFLSLANGNMGLGALWNGSAPMGAGLISLRVVRDQLLDLTAMASYV